MLNESNPEYVRKEGNKICLLVNIGSGPVLVKLDEQAAEQVFIEFGEALGLLARKEAQIPYAVDKTLEFCLRTLG